MRFVAQRVPIQVAVVFVAAATAARADIDRSQYHEIPDGGAPTFQTMPVPWIYWRDHLDKVNCNTNPPPTGDYDVYVDRNGVATAVDVIRSIPGCDEFVAHNLLAGRQISKPNDSYIHHYTVALRFESPDKPGTKAKNVPYHMFDTSKISGDMPRLPDAVKAHSKQTTLVWLGKVCVDIDGDVNQVSVISGIPGGDDAIAATLRTWRLRRQPVPICTLLRFEFVIGPPAKK